jgi:hypothetical protein
MSIATPKFSRKPSKPWLIKFSVAWMVEWGSHSKYETGVLQQGDPGSIFSLGLGVGVFKYRPRINHNYETPRNPDLLAITHHVNGRALTLIEIGI